MTAALDGQLAASGLVGALTALVVQMTRLVVPDGNLKSVIAITAWMFASLVAFEAMAWFVRLRLRWHRRAVEQLIPELEALQAKVDAGIARQLQVMKDHNAAKDQIKDAERKVIDCAAAIIDLLDDLKRKSLQISRDLERDLRR